VYIGTQPAIGQNRKLDSLAASFNGSASTFNLTVNTSPIVPSNVYQLFISLGGVLQNPGVDFTVSGNQITFTTIPAAGLSFFGIFQGDSITGTPTIADASITTLKLATGLTVTHTAGTAGAPSVTFAGDLNTGIYSPGADQVAISTNGTGRLFVDSSGNVGIGTSPSVPFHLLSSSFPLATFKGSSASTGNSVSFVNNGDVGASLITYGSTYAGGSFLSVGANGTALSATNDFAVNAGSTLRFGIASTERMRLDSSGRLGLGTSAVTGTNTRLEVSNDSAEIKVSSTSAFNANFRGIRFGVTGDSVDYSGIRFQLNSGELRTEAGFATWGGFQTFYTNGLERLRITTGGLVGIGTTSPGTILAINDPGTGLGFTNAASGNLNIGLLAGTGSTDAYVFNRANAPILFGTNNTERLRIDSSGRLLVGTSTARSAFGNEGISSIFQVEGLSNNTARYVSQVYNANDSGSAVHIFGKSRGTTLGSVTVVQIDDVLADLRFEGADGTDFVTGASIRCHVDGTPGANDMPGRLVFSTTADGASGPTERMRIGENGVIRIGQTTSDAPAATNTAGIAIGPTYLSVSRSGDLSIEVNRISNDGDLVRFLQDGTQEGTISVSGTTVSYNGAHLSRWSQLPDGAIREEILRGTVLSNLDEMCEWGEEDNEQLNRMKISDVEGDPNVSGVFQAWDDDDDTYTDDFYCAMTGDFIIRIAAGVTVQRGQLLMSAGDGTAKPQGDGFVQDKTVAKVTSTHVTCTYEDGSYCVPCVLMAC